MYRQRRERPHPYLQHRLLYTGIYQPDQQTDVIRKQCIDMVEQKIQVDKEDKTAARELVDAILRAIIAEVRRQPGGKIYGHNVKKAGSYPVNTKIGKADEFDTNIPLNLSLEKVHRKRKIKYSFETPNGLYTMTSNTLQHAVQPVYIPRGHCVIEIDNASVLQKFQHTAKTLLNRGIVEDCIQLIPKDIKDDLLAKLRRAIRTLNLESIVSLQRIAHGPALTLVYKSGTIESVQHNISIDIVASVSYKVNMSKFEWPRSETWKAFSADLIERVLQAGTHLVPKHDLYWSVSFSRMERELQSGIDAGFGCRKFVLRILKKMVQKWKSHDSKFRNISSHIIKTQLFWSCEIHCDELNYWYRNNRDLCLFNTMKELEEALRAGELPGYFFNDVNLLDEKTDMSLLSLADFIAEKRKYLKLFPSFGYMHHNNTLKFVASLLLQ